MDFFAKAKENFEAAQICFDKGLYNACANRAYYSALQAAVAALAQKGIRRDRIEHKWVQADFSGNLIRRQKVYPARLKSYLSDMQFVRDKADYYLTAMILTVGAGPCACPASDSGISGFRRHVSARTGQPRGDCPYSSNLSCSLR